MKQWFNKLNKWTDRQPLAGLLVVAALCLCGIVLCFDLETVIARQGVASFVSGVLTGMLLTSVFHVIDVTRGK